MRVVDRTARSPSLNFAGPIRDWRRGLGTRVVGPCIACVLAFGATAAANPRVLEKARLEVQPAGTAFKRISIDNALGDVIVEGHDGTAIHIETSKTAPDEEALDRLRISLVPNPDGTVRITTTADRDRENRPLRRGAVRIDLKVRAPRDARIEATASTGALRVSNMDNGGELDTASGEIEVKNVAGELSTHSVSGPTSLEQVFGSVDSHTLSSDLAFNSIAGERLIASANHGKISGRRVRSREVQLTTHRGHISLEAEASLRGRIVVATLSGSIDVRLRHHHHAVLVRARGNKVNLGGMTTAARPDGWVESRIGAADDKLLPMLVEMRSRVGNVQLVLVD
jgi:hypothetical protein